MHEYKFCRIFSSPRFRRFPSPPPRSASFNIPARTPSWPRDTVRMTKPKIYPNTPMKNSWHSEGLHYTDSTKINVAIDDHLLAPSHQISTLEKAISIGFLICLYPTQRRWNRTADSRQVCQTVGSDLGAIGRSPVGETNSGEKCAAPSVIR